MTTWKSPSPESAGAGRAKGRRHFLRHYLEMIAAMLVGMAVLGAAVRGVLAVAGLELPSGEVLLSAEMAAEMAVAMVVWMRYRGHGWASTLEMAGAMFAPLAALYPLVLLGTITSGSLMMLEHLAMLPLMFLLMLRRRAEYAGGTHA